jgi:hypothetical protein
MKNLKTSVFVLLIGVFVFGCKKVENASSSEKPITNFKQIVSSPDFNWKNTHQVNLKIAAANVPVAISNTLVITTETGETIFKKLHKMNESFLAPITLPKSVKKVIITYGSIKKTVAVANQTIDFNFITESTIIE